jgi:hypothetical protein
MTMPYISHQLSTPELLRASEAMSAHHVRVLRDRLADHARAVATVRETLPALEQAIHRGELAAALALIDHARAALALR